MQGILLLGHGQFASGLRKASEQIIGVQTHFISIDFTEAMSTEDLNRLIATALQQLKVCSHITILTDLLGGSPFRSACLFSLEQPNLQVITGTNLQMLLEVLLERESLTFAELHQFCLDSGHQGISSLELQNHTHQAKQSASLCDGI